jgi:hypothetical protein
VKHSLFAALAALVVLGGIAAGCMTEDTDELKDRVDAVETRVDEAEQNAQLTSMVAALETLGNAGLHDIDEAAADGQVPEAGTGGVDAAIVAVSAAQWPDELQGAAGELVATLQELLEAMSTEDPDTIAPVAADAHDAGHDFEHEALNHIKEVLGLPVEEEHEEGGETPAAGETPSGGETPSNGETPANGETPEA